MSKLDKFLYLYSTGFVILLVTTSAFNSTKGPSNLVIGAIFAPVAIFLIFTFIHFLKGRSQQKKAAKKAATSELTQIIEDDQQQKNIEEASHRSFLSHFFHQSDKLFYLTISLFVIAITSLCIRTVTELTTQPIHPLSQSNSQPISYQLPPNS